MIHVKMIIPVWNNYAQFMRILAGILGVICICLIALQGTLVEKILWIPGFTVLFAIVIGYISAKMKFASSLKIENGEIRLRIQGKDVILPVTDVNVFHESANYFVDKEIILYFVPKNIVGKNVIDWQVKKLFLELGPRGIIAKNNFPVVEKELKKYGVKVERW